MTESSVERFGQIRKAVKQAKEYGISDTAVRREAVINARTAQLKGILQILEGEAIYFPSVAEPDLRKEEPEVVDRAINKYLIVKEGLPRVPVLIDAVHASKPVNVQEGSRALDEYDEFTGDIAARVAELTGSSLIVAKKSRLISDLNRAWWTREERSEITPKEYPRSARAALYWAVRKILLGSKRLDGEEKLTSRYCRVAVHGMKDHDDFDFAIAGSERPADPEFLNWFSEEFIKSLKEVGIEPKVVVAFDTDEKERSAYSGPTSLRYFRELPKKDYLYQHPAFGLNFQTIQLEISKRMRINPENRELVSLALANVVKKLG